MGTSAGQPRPDHRLGPRGRSAAGGDREHRCARCRSIPRRVAGGLAQPAPGPRVPALRGQPALNRPVHVFGDQDVLTALLGSRAWSHVPVRLLRRGLDIVQAKGPSGFTPTERLRSLRQGAPVAVHAMGRKPWTRTLGGRAGVRAAAWRDRYESLHLQLSPYTRFAAEYRHDLEEDTSWLDERSWTARLARGPMPETPILEELPLAIADSFGRHVRQALGLGRLRRISATRTARPVAA